MLYIYKYASEFGRKLEDDLASETSGHFKRLLVAQCNAGRDEGLAVDFGQAQKDAKDIYEVIFTGFVVAALFAQ